MNLIVACDLERGIGKNNTIPWHLPSDLKHFQRLTTGNYPDQKNIVIMGRNTWDSLPRKPLPNRTNIVITSRPETIEKQPDLLVFTSLESAIGIVGKNRSSDELRDVFIIGGAEIYRKVLELDIVDTIHFTKIMDTYQCDRFFPEIPNFDQVSSSVIIKTKNGPEHQYQTWKRHRNDAEYRYLALCQEILSHGSVRMDRTSVGTMSLFGKTLEFSLRDGNMPLLTTKKMAWKTICRELLWFISGSTNSKELEKHGIKIWTGNTSREFLDRRGLGHLPEGDIGAGYGFQWRHFGAEYQDMNTDYTGQGVDQLAEVIRLIKTDPTSRRILLNTWNVADLNKMALPPCHMMVQFYVDNGLLSATMYQRSADIFLGVPFNIASYALLVHIISRICGLKADRLVMNFGDVHAYQNHCTAINRQISRTPNRFPKVSLDRIQDLDDITLDKIHLIDYQSHGPIKADMAI